MTSVAVIGVGNMGHPMARHIASSGFAVGVSDANIDIATAVGEELDVPVLVEPEEFADVEFVITMLPTSTIVAEVLLQGGIAAELPEGAYIIDMSSSNPADTLVTAAEVAEHGVTLVDAPVSGGVAGAEAGTLTIMLGGDDDQVTPVLPLLDTMSKAIFRTGPVGSAHAMKALNNVVAGATTLAAFEALAAGRHYGLDAATMVDIWNHSTARSFVTEVVMPNHVLTGHFDSGYPLPLYAKDVNAAASLVAAADVDAPLVRRVAEVFSAALEQLGDVDHTCLGDLHSPEGDAS